MRQVPVTPQSVLKKGSDPLDVERILPAFWCLAYPAVRGSDPFFNTLSGAWNDGRPRLTQGRAPRLDTSQRWRP
jgi:hypothetical protein